MSRGITDPPNEVAQFWKVVQGSTAGELINQLKDLPPDTPVAWVDSYKDEDKVTAGIGFRWRV